MKNPLLQPEVIAALDIGSLSQDDRITFLSSYVDSIFEAAITRFDTLLSEPDQQELRVYLATDPEPEDLVSHLMKEYDNFAVVLKAVAAEIKAGQDESKV